MIIINLGIALGVHDAYTHDNRYQRQAVFAKKQPLQPSKIKSVWYAVDAIARVHHDQPVKEASKVLEAIAYRMRQKTVNAKVVCDAYAKRYPQIQFSKKEISIGDAGVTVNDFCISYKQGRYILDCGKRWVPVVNGRYYADRDCGNKPIIRAIVIEGTNRKYIDQINSTGRCV